MRAGLWACVLAVSCVSVASAQRTIRVEGADYAYDVPAGWQEQSTPGVDRMHGSVTAPGRTINITSEAFAGSSADYLQASLTGLRNEASVTLRGSRPTRVGALEAYEIESDWREDDITVHLLQVAVANGRTGFVLTCGDIAQRFAQAEPECRAIFRTFVVRPALQQAQPQAASGTRVAGPNFAYTVPNGWTEQQNASVDRMHGSVAYPGRTINITTEAFAGSAAEYLQASLSGLRGQSSVVVRGSRQVRVGAREAYEIESDWSEGGVRVHLLQIATVYGGTGYVLTCGDLAERFSQADPECRAIFRTFLVGPESSGQPAVQSHTISASPDALTARVRAAVDARSSELSECQAAALRRGPVSGQVELELAVRRDGSVARVRVLNDSTGSFGLAPCVQGVVSGVRVSDPPASETIVRHTVAFGR